MAKLKAVQVDAPAYLEATDPIDRLGDVVSILDALIAVGDSAHSVAPGTISDLAAQGYRIALSVLKEMESARKSSRSI